MDIQRLLYKFRKTIVGRIVFIPYNWTCKIFVFFRIAIGKKLGWKVPNSYTMKIEWIRQNDRNPLYVTLADKVAVKDYVKNIIGERYLIKNIGVYKDVSEIDFNKLPNKFVLKTNNASGTNIICVDKSKLNIKHTKELLSKWVKNRHFGWKSGEWHYRLIEPRILCEEFINDKDGKLLDYKFFCFNGIPRYVWVDVDRYKDTKARAIFNINWERIPMTLTTPDYDGEIKKPLNYDTMLDLAKRLCVGFRVVRVDLYNVDGKIYFGEMTFFSGDMFFSPRKYDKIWGNFIDLGKE